MQSKRFVITKNIVNFFIAEGELLWQKHRISLQSSVKVLHDTRRGSRLSKGCHFA